jgi:serine/threonine protein kinase
MCAALECAHGQRIIHRDLKPSNVMVLSDGSSKVMDFGIAHQSRTGSELTQTAAWGTPPYMAPEQELGRVSAASDLYALAVMAYEMVVGQRPFAGPYFLEKKLKKEYAAPSSVDPALPAGLDGFFARALDPEPEKRWPAARQFADAFSGIGPAV